MSEKHTPEPWFVAKGSDGYRYIVDGSGFAIADGLFEADAEYIVERMNACSGQTTEDLKLAAAHRDACIMWESEMMKAIGEDGVGSVSEAIAELKSQLSSANARLDLAVKALEDIGHEFIGQKGYESLATYLDVITKIQRRRR